MPTQSTAKQAEQDRRAQGALPLRLGVRSRRGFIRAATGGGVFLAVQARTALGQTVCQSPSAEISGNLSVQPGAAPCSGGVSPTVWKLQISLSAWPAASASAPTFKTSASLDDMAYKANDVNPKSVLNDAGTLVSDVLPGATVATDMGIWEFLAFPPDTGNTELMLHLIAAWLNAGYYPDYPIQRGQVREMWEALAGGGTYCPSSLICSDTMGMSAGAVIAYISGMYESTSELIYVCRKSGSASTTDTSGGS